MPYCPLAAGMGAVHSLMIAFLLPAFCMEERLATHLQNLFGLCPKGKWMRFDILLNFEQFVFRRPKPSQKKLQ
jgi:hypothetical protein